MKNKKLEEDFKVKLTKEQEEIVNAFEKLDSNNPKVMFEVGRAALLADYTIKCYTEINSVFEDKNLTLLEKRALAIEVSKKYGKLIEEASKRKFKNGK